MQIAGVISFTDFRVEELMVLVSTNNDQVRRCNSRLTARVRSEDY
jgi:hypothetical protein